jgi:hypothetical protein
MISLYGVKNSNLATKVNSRRHLGDILVRVNHSKNETSFPVNHVVLIIGWYSILLLQWRKCKSLSAFTIVVSSCKFDLLQCHIYFTYIHVCNICKLSKYFENKNVWIQLINGLKDNCYSDVWSIVDLKSSTKVWLEMSTTFKFIY